MSEPASQALQSMNQHFADYAATRLPLGDLDFHRSLILIALDGLPADDTCHGVTLVSCDIDPPAIAGEGGFVRLVKPHPGLLFVMESGLIFSTFTKTLFSARPMRREIPYDRVTGVHRVSVVGSRDEGVEFVGRSRLTVAVKKSDHQGPVDGVREALVNEVSRRLRA